MNLHVIDLSPVIYAGAVDKKAVIEGEVYTTPEGGFDRKELPSGGLRFLFNIIYNYVPNDRVVFTADRDPIFKRKLLPCYKENRVKTWEIELQKLLAEKIINSCGIELIYRDEYEADDIIYTLVEKYKYHFDKVYVHTADSDLYFLADDNVEILPTSSKGKHITKENYEYTVKKNMNIRYNSLTFNKVMYGDKSDCIPPIDPKLAKRLQCMYVSPKIAPMLGDYNKVVEIVSSLCKAALTQIRIVYPVFLPDVELEMGDEPSMMKIISWGKILNNKNFLNNRSPILKSVQEECDKLFELDNFVI